MADCIRVLYSNWRMYPLLIAVFLRADRSEVHCLVIMRVVNVYCLWLLPFYLRP